MATAAAFTSGAGGSGGVFRLLLRTTFLFLKTADRFLEGFGLSAVQYDALRTLLDEPELSQVDLSRRLGVNRASITFLVDRLEKAGLVERTPVAGDRRARALRVTAAGRSRLDRVEAPYRRLVRRWLAASPRGDLATLERVCQRLQESLQEEPG